MTTDENVAKDLNYIKEVTGMLVARNYAGAMGKIERYKGILQQEKRELSEINKGLEQLMMDLITKEIENHRIPKLLPGEAN